MPYLVTKTYTHSIGLSCAFRQWRAKSHCRFLHGYALQVALTFAALTLDENNWVMDFGGLKYIRKLLEDLLDHKTLVAEDDPHRSSLQDLATLGIIDIRLLPVIGCEGLANYIFDLVDDWLIRLQPTNGCHLHSVEVREHDGNAATYRKD